MKIRRKIGVDIDGVVADNFAIYTPLIDYLHLDTIKDSKKYIEMLSREKHEIYFLTQRLHISINPIYLFDAFFDTHTWIEQNFRNCKERYYKEIHFVKDKIKFARKKGLDLLIDDNPDLAKACVGSNISILLFDCPCNQGISGSNIIRVHNWEQIYKEINKRN